MLNRASEPSRRLPGLPPVMLTLDIGCDSGCLKSGTCRCNNRSPLSQGAQRERVLHIKSSGTQPCGRTTRRSRTANCLSSHGFRPGLGNCLSIYWIGACNLGPYKAHLGPKRLLCACTSEAKKKIAKISSATSLSCLSGDSPLIPPPQTPFPDLPPR